MTKKLSEKVFGIRIGFIHAKAQFEKHTAVMNFYMRTLLYSCISGKFFMVTVVTYW